YAHRALASRSHSPSPTRRSSDLMAAFSFCQDKIITTGGEGGLLALDDEGWFKTAWAFKDHGKGYDTVYNTEHPPGYRWLHDGFRSEEHTSELQSRENLVCRLLLE